MTELRAEIELTVELRKFFNIDLFVQGYYQIRTGVKFASRIQSTTKIDLKSELIPNPDDSNEQIYPASIFNDWGVSKTFLIIYKNEEVELNDQFNFKLSVIVDAENITESFNRLDMQLCIELYFSEKSYTMDKLTTMQQLCCRCYKLYFNPRLGIHIHIPIFFDYFHLSALTTTIHASLLCLLPTYVIDRPNAQRTSLFSFLFGQDLSQITIDQVNSNLLKHAYQLHNNLCEILLASYESLQDFYEKMIEHLPSTENKPIHVHQKCRQKLKNLCEELKMMDDIHTIDSQAHAHIAQCSAGNIMLWGRFIECFGLHQITANILSKEYHNKRIKRLSEGFFLRETSRINLLVNEGDNYNELHELVRNSLYYSRLPHLSIECIELDGIPDTFPILIEEVYSPTDLQIKNENLPLETTPIIHRKHSEILSSSVPSTPRLRSQQSKIDTIPSSPIIRPPIKKIFSFRNRTPSVINPIVALSNESSVKLTSFRKVDQNFSTEFNSNYYNQRSKSSRMKKQVSRYSLPDVPLQRSNSLSNSHLNLLDSPIIPKFLRSTSDKNNNNDDDDVFLSTDQQQTVDPTTFGDSSTKSKILRESYRRKANTEDRRGIRPGLQRSLSTSHQMQPKYFLTQTNINPLTTASNEPIVNNPLESVLNLTLQLEKSSIDDIQRRHTISDNDINPLLLNGLTDDENQRNLIEKTNGHSSIENNDNKQNDRIQINNSITSQTIEYVVYKEKIKEIISSKYSSNLILLSDLSTPISTVPYFSQEIIPYDLKGIHLIICVHGLDGNSGDLRLIKTYLELCLPACQLDFLMSSANHSSTFDDISVMVTQLIDEINIHIERYSLKPKRISFVGHSLGNLIIRATVSDSRFQQYRKQLYTYFSLSGPHLGTLFNTSGLVNTGLWLMQKWKKSRSLAQMSLKDHINPTETYLYKLSKEPCLEFFKNILLLASPQDRYVPFHSARIEVCKAALKDTVYGSIYVQMINNLLGPIVRDPSINFIRYNAFHNIPSGANNIIGRAAHIAILDSELFVEKLISISAAKYFK